MIDSKKIKLCTILSAAVFLLSGCNSAKPNAQSAVQSNAGETAAPSNSPSSTPGSTSSNTQSSTQGSSSDSAQSGRNSAGNKENGTKSGLLLGLVKEPDVKNQTYNNTNFENKTLEEYRTLWIYENANDISYLEKKGGIITPYGDKFMKLTSSSVIIPTINADANRNSDDFYFKYSSYYNFSVVIAQGINEAKSLLTKESLTKNYISSQEGDICGDFVSRTESIQYVGNKYAAVKTSQYSTGGGTLRVGSDDIKLYDIKNLTSLGNNRANVSLKSLLGNDVDNKIKPLSQKYNKKETGNTNQLVQEKYAIDDTNLTLTRKEGKWIVQAPLYEDYYHDGNGSSFKLVNALYDTDIEVPKAITGNDTLSVDWNTIKSKIPDAKDAVSSPNKDMLAVLTSSDLRIFVHPEKGLDKPVKTIAVDKNEKIVSDQWSTGQFVDSWTKAVGGY